jgi:hypothetical protein
VDDSIHVILDPQQIARVFSFTPRPLYPVHTDERDPEAGWTPEPVWTTWRREKYCLYRGWNSDFSAAQSVAGRYID